MKHLMSRRSRTALLLSLSLLFLTFTACQSWRLKWKNFQENFLGLSMTIESYDENSQLIDSLHGKSVSIERDTQFDSSEESSDSPVLRLTIGRHIMQHVGSSLIMYEDGLNNIFTEFKQKQNVKDMDLSLPVMNRLFSTLENRFTGRAKVVLIRSQNGTPLATFAGNKVSIFKTDVPKSSGLLVDGKKLYIYRCDFSIYDRELLEN